MTKRNDPDQGKTPGDGDGPHSARDYIESMLEQLAELATREGERKIASALRMAALEISRI